MCVSAEQEVIAIEKQKYKRQDKPHNDRDNNVRMRESILKQ